MIKAILLGLACVLFLAGLMIALPTIGVGHPPGGQSPGPYDVIVAALVFFFGGAQLECYRSHK